MLATDITVCAQFLHTAFVLYTCLLSNHELATATKSMNVLLHVINRLHKLLSGCCT